MPNHSEADGKKFQPAPPVFVADMEPQDVEPEAPVVMTDEEAQKQGFVKMAKDGQVIHVHPFAAENHRIAHWHVVKMEPAADSAPAVTAPDKA